MHKTDTMQALFATNPAVENNRFNLHRGRELRIFRPILREENLAAYSVRVFG